MARSDPFIDGTDFLECRFIIFKAFQRKHLLSHVCLISVLYILKCEPFLLVEKFSSAEG